MELLLSTERGKDWPWQWLYKGKSHRLIFTKSNTIVSVKNVFDQSSFVFCALELVILVSCIFCQFEIFINVILFFVSQTCIVWRLLEDGCCSDIDLGTGEFEMFARRLWSRPEMWRSLLLFLFRTVPTIYVCLLLQVMEWQRPSQSL